MVFEKTSSLDWIHKISSDFVFIYFNMYIYMRVCVCGMSLIHGCKYREFAREVCQMGREKRKERGLIVKYNEYKNWIYIGGVGQNSESWD